MKIQLYIIDYHLKKSSGLTTYVDHLTNGLSKIQEISLNYIGINAKIDSEVERHRIKNETHLLYSNELVLSNKSSNDKLISLLKKPKSRSEVDNSPLIPPTLLCNFPRKEKIKSSFSLSFLIILPNEKIFSIYCAARARL